MKKTLLIFFGELRTFEYVIPHLKKLDKVDVMLSTWMESKRYDDKFEIDENKIHEIYPNIKYCNIVDFKQIDDFKSKNNSWKVQHHWKTSINSIKNYDEYDTVILHRCDLISNWHTILDMDTKDDTIYLHYVEYHPSQKIDAYPADFWVNDYYFFGKPTLVKKFINLMNSKFNKSPHYDMWEVIDKNNINIENVVLKAALVRDKDIEWHQNNEINPSDLSPLQGPEFKENVKTII